MPTSVALGSHFEEFVKKQLESGRFNNVSIIFFTVGDQGVRIERILRGSRDLGRLLSEALTQR